MQIHNSHRRTSAGRATQFGRSTLSTAGAGRRTVARVLVGAAMVAAIVSATPNLASAVPPPPPNPSDSDLSSAAARVDDSSGRVGQLIGLVASANQQLAEMSDMVAIRREDVNKALVDLQNARDEADAAAAVVTLAQQALAGAGDVIAAAQRNFSAFAVNDYVKGTGAAGISSLLDSQGPQDVLDRAAVLRLLSAKQNATLDNLQRARADQANKDSAARASKVTADRAASEADAKKVEAQDAIDAAVAAQQDQEAQAAAVTAQRDSAQSELDQAKQSAAGLQGQRQNYESWDQQRQAEEAAAAEAAAAAAQAAKDAAAQAAVRVAANAAANKLAASLADSERSHTDVDTSDDASDVADVLTGSTTTGSTVPKSSAAKPSTTSGSTAKVDTTVTGSAAIETVIDRGMSQLGVQYSWGGGNSQGPTKGIRDGGVADRYGDYNKVGFDCSGLMMYAFGGVGIKLAHYTGYQYTAGKQVPSSQMKRGDMIFYGPNASQHVALYLGNGKMLEAPQSGDVVKVSPVRQGGMTPYVVRMIT